MITQNFKWKYNEQLCHSVFLFLFFKAHFVYYLEVSVLGWLSANKSNPPDLIRKYKDGFVFSFGIRMKLHTSFLFFGGPP